MGSFTYGKYYPVEWLPQDCLVRGRFPTRLRWVSFRKILTQAGFSFVRVDELRADPEMEILPHELHH